MPSLISRWTYYLRSIPTLLIHIQERGAILRLFLGLPIPTPRQITLTNGLKFIIRTAMDVWIIKETCLDKDYETHGVLLQDGWTVVDIGAGLGDFTVYAAHKLPQGRVIAYEPFPESYDLLQKNLALNGIHNAQVIHGAVGGSDTPLYLSTETGIPVKHSTETTAETGTIQVSSRPLADALSEAGVAHCDFLKMDCEGAEYPILLNADTATLQKIKRMSLEYHENITPHTHQELVDHLEKHGFTVRVTPNPAHDHIGFLYASR